MGNAGLARARNEGLAQRLERLRLRGGQRPKRNALGPRRARREQDFQAAYREREYAASRALQKGASFHLIHAVLPMSAPRTHCRSCGPACSELFQANRGPRFRFRQRHPDGGLPDQLAMLFQFVASCSAPRSDSALSVNVGLAELSVGKIPHPAT